MLVTAGAPCRGRVSPTCQSNMRTNTFFLEKGLADATNQYYLLMRLTIIGGNDAVDGSIKSARGQSCVITDYVASTGAVTCDFTRSLEHGYVMYGYSGTSTGAWLEVNSGGTVVPNALATAAADAAYTIFTTWVPSDYKAPFYALIGDVGWYTPLEIIRVTAMSVEGTQYKLQVRRSVAGSGSVSFTHAESKARVYITQITYSKAFLLADVAAGDTFIMVTDLSYNYVLPTGTISNWFAKIQSGASAGVSEVVKVLKATAATWRLSLETASGHTNVKLKINADLDAYPTGNGVLISQGDVLRIGPSATGTILTVSAASSTYAAASSEWTVGITGTVGAIWVVNTEVTLVSRKNVPNPTMLQVLRGQVRFPCTHARAKALIVHDGTQPRGYAIMGLSPCAMSAVRCRSKVFLRRDR
jgi:hypothetical protein